MARRSVTVDVETNFDVPIRRFRAPTVSKDRGHYVRCKSLPTYSSEVKTMLQNIDDKVVRMYWDKSKQKAFKCPWCGAKRIFLWKSRNRKFKRYLMACTNCYSAANRAFTVSGAIRKWRRFCKLYNKKKYTRRS